ncbi:metacaspase-3-like [Senna tora]|uniref:Metacaspase-3-like n=1 Tax=Senna tora TaxID=362788 RepID=A0A834XGT7_9FABA|nr:metacaspase-3-like [Senna tora]
MARRRERFCECGAPPGVPHYCQANNDRQMGNGFRGPAPYGNWGGYGAPNFGYPPQQYNRPVMRPQVPPQAPFMAAPYNGGGNKRAVLCGITYGKGSHALKGSVNDVLLMKRFLIEDLGFRPDSIVVLRDDQNKNPKTIPTKANIIEAMKWLVRGCKAGDSLVFHYSGHGSRVEDNDMDEHDGFDEAICPIDFQDEGKIRDDTINAILVRPLPPATKLHAIIDTCYSGTVLDLPYMCRMNSRLRQYAWQDHMSGKPYYKSTNGGLAVCISACDDDGTSGDTSAFGMNGGALTQSFVVAMQKEPGLTYGHLLHSMRSIIHGAKQQLGLNTHQQQFHINHRQHYAHEPQLSASERFDIHSKPVAI